MYTFQIVGFLMLVFVATIYFSVKRKPSYQHTLFVSMTILSTICVISEFVTSVMLASSNAAISNAARFGNYIYVFGTFILFFGFFEFAKYISAGEPTGKWYKKTPTLIPALACFVAEIIREAVTPSAVVTADNPKIGSPFMGVCAGIYASASLVYVLARFKKIDKIKRRTVILMLVSEGTLMFLQHKDIYNRIASFGFVILLFAFYVTIESPDAILIEKLKDERERADEANMAKTAFLANMSHEIRTPLNVIMGMSDILLKTELDSKQKSCLKSIEHSGKSLLLIIGDLLDFSKNEAGEFELEECSYDPVSMLNDLGMIVLTKIGEKNIDFRLSVDQKMPGKLFGDESHIRQILVNLLNNAVKFTDKGHIELRVSITEVRDSIATLSCEIIDTGCGIRGENMESLFDAFKQGDMNRNRSKDGTGLGLSISKQLVDLLDGELSVESEYGQGSRFTVRIKQKIEDETPSFFVENASEKSVGIMLDDFDASTVEDLCIAYGVDNRRYLPDELGNIKTDYLIISDDIYEKHKTRCDELSHSIHIGVLQNPMKTFFVEENIQSIVKPVCNFRFCNFINGSANEISGPENDNDGMFTAPKAMILLVDDNDINLQVASGLFENFKMQIDLAHSGMEAIEMAGAKQYNIIFMDHMMPGMDGVETTAKIRALGAFAGYYEDSPIVALTANVSSDAKNGFKSVGVLDMITKPIDMKLATRIIRKNLPKRYIVNVDKVELENMAAEEVKTPKKELPIIGDLDVELAITYSGSYELFEKLLGEFYKIIDMKSKLMEDYLNDGLIDEFTIEAHALKNTARLIGAMELSEMFKTLEFLGKDKNADEIEKLFPVANERYRGYKDVLRPYAKLDTGDKKEVEKDVVIEVIEDMKLAVEAFDIDRVDSDMKMLEGYKLREETEPIMERLRSFVSDVAMENIIATADELIDCINLN